MQSVEVCEPTKLVPRSAPPRLAPETDWCKPRRRQELWGRSGFKDVRLVEIDPSTPGHSVVSDLGSVIGVPTDLLGAAYQNHLAVDPQGLVHALLLTTTTVFVLDRATGTASALTL